MSARACRATSCTHPRNPMPEVVQHLVAVVEMAAFDPGERSERERLAIARARAEYPGRARELRHLEAEVLERRRLERASDDDRRDRRRRARLRWHRWESGVYA